MMLGWRLSHRHRYSIEGQVIESPMRWMITRTGEPLKLRAFSSLAADFDTEYSTVLIERATSEQIAEQDDIWFAEREARYIDGGYEKINRLTYKDGTIICSLASKGATNFAYCKSKAGLLLIYSGIPKLIESAANMLP